MVGPAAGARSLRLGDGIRGEAPEAELEREIGVAVESQGCGTERGRNPPDQALELVGAELELDGGSGKVPSDVLAADEVVRGAVVEVDLENSAVGQHEPFPGMEAAVDHHRAELGAESIRRPSP